MKRTAVKVISLVLAIVLISLSLAPVAIANNRISDARSSILRVATETGTGSAFVIAQSGQTTHLVTNLHVVSGASTVIILTDDITGSWIPVTQIIYLPDGLDLVLLITTSGLANRPVLPLARAETVRAAQSVYALGFPGASDIVRDDWDMLPSSVDDVTVNGGVVSNPIIVMDDGINVIQSDVPITFGNSGGPLLNENAEVIGVNTWGYSEDSWGASYSIHIDYIIDECEARGIPYVPASRGFLFDNMLFVVILVIVLVLGGLLAVILSVQKSKSRNVAPSTAQGPSQTAYAAPRPAPPAPPAYAAPQMQQQAPQQQVPQQRQLFCVKGQLAGNSFPIYGKLAIGRDPGQCQVIYPADTKGISSVHCEVSLQQGSIYLTDKGSTYGTFLSGGQKLAPNQSVMLQSGAVFYLADPINEFKIT